MSLSDFAKNTFRSTTMLYLLMAALFTFGITSAAFAAGPTLTVTPSLSAPGDTITLHATGFPPNATLNSVIVGPTNGSGYYIDASATFDGSGNATFNIHLPLNMGVSDSYVTIWTSGFGAGEAQATADFDLLTSAVNVTGVALSADSLSLTVGQTPVTLTATVSPSNATNKNITWASTDSTVASVVNGVVTPLKAGTTIISVTTENGTFYKGCNVIVTGQTVNVTGVTLSAHTRTIALGGTPATLTATVAPTNATNKKLNWVSSNTSVASVADGVVTPLKAGRTVITVTSQSASFSDRCNVTVTTSDPQVMTPQNDVPAYHPWTITFSQALDADINVSSLVTVVDSQNNPVNVAVALGSDGKTIVVSAPSSGYAAGGKYYINISNEITSSGQPLVRPVRMEFNIAAALPALTLQAVSAVNGNVTATLNGIPLIFSDFEITRSIDSGAATPITQPIVTADGPTTHFYVPMVNATSATQNVVYTVRYKGGTPISAAPFQVLGDITGTGNFNNPTGVAVDNSGNVYVVDYYHAALKKLASGSTTWENATGNYSNFAYFQPYNVAVDNAGTLYVTEDLYTSVHGPAVNKRVSVGTPWTDANSGNGNFAHPYGIAVDNSGNIYVADADIKGVKKMTGNSWTDISSSGDFSSPWGIAVDSSGCVYVTDTTTCKVKKLVNGTWTDITYDGNFAGLSGVAIDNAGYVYVADSGASKIKKLASGSTSWTDITGKSDLSSPIAIAVDSSGNVIVTQSNNKIKRMTK